MTGSLVLPPADSPRCSTPSTAAGLSRRAFVQGLGCAAGVTACCGAQHASLAADGAASAPRPIKLAAIYTVFNHRSHANVILENFLEPYYFSGQVIDPRQTVTVAALCGDQTLDGDMAEEVSRAYGIPRFKTIAAALCLGGSRLAVDAVLSIGEGGRYPVNSLGQVEFPRKRFFDEIVRVMERSRRMIPLFSDKHLSYRSDYAKEMYDTVTRLWIPFMAGSSIPVAERRPPLDLPSGAAIAEAVAIHGWKADIYDFHALEALQSLVEFRKGGETGVAQVQFVEGDELWKAASDGRWSEKAADAAMRAESDSKSKAWRQWQPPPYGILIDYKDGLRAAVLRIGEDSTRWNFACRLHGEDRPRATRFYVGPWRNRYCFKALGHAMQRFVTQGRAPYPVERTLLTTGILEAAMRSRHVAGKALLTPHLAIAYQPVDFRDLRETGATWKVIDESIPEPKGIAKTVPARAMPGKDQERRN